MMERIAEASPRFKARMAGVFQLLRLQLQTDPHSPRHIRINGVVHNMPEFGQAFGCKTGQPMMPTNACHVS